MDCAVRKLKILVALAGFVKSRVEPLAESFDHAELGMIGIDPRMLYSIQVGLTALFMLTTIVEAFGVDMLVIVVGKKPVTYGAQLAGDAATPALMTSKVNITSLDVIAWPLFHFHGFSVIVIVLSPLDHVGGFATLSAASTVGVEPCGA